MLQGHHADRSQERGAGAEAGRHSNRDQAPYHPARGTRGHEQSKTRGVQAEDLLHEEDVG